MNLCTILAAVKHGEKLIPGYMPFHCAGEVSSGARESMLSAPLSDSKIPGGRMTTDAMDVEAATNRIYRHERQILTPSTIARTRNDVWPKREGLLLRSFHISSSVTKSNPLVVECGALLLLFDVTTY